MPFQSILVAEAKLRIDRDREAAREFATYPVGQIVGDMHEEQSVRTIVYDMLTEFVEATERLHALLTT